MGERERLLKVLKDGVEEVGDPSCFYIMDALRIAELDDKALAASEQRNRELTRQVEQFMATLERIGAMSVRFTCACGRPTGTGAIKSCADKALAALTAPPSSAPTDPGEMTNGNG